VARVCGARRSACERDHQAAALRWIDSGAGIYRVSKPAGHTNVSLWYALRGNRAVAIACDQQEFFVADSLQYHARGTTIVALCGSSR
jgi:hypothetical protein